MRLYVAGTQRGQTCIRAKDACSAPHKRTGEIMIGTWLDLEICSTIGALAVNGSPNSRL